jgi:hypothetical protein
MRSTWWCALGALASTFVVNHAVHAQSVPAPAPAAPAASEACGTFQEFVTTSCPLTWHGITIYGTYDVGVGWVSHGLPAAATPRTRVGTTP